MHMCCMSACFRIACLQFVKGALEYYNAALHPCVSGEKSVCSIAVISIDILTMGNPKLQHLLA